MQKNGKSRNCKIKKHIKNRKIENLEIVKLRNISKTRKNVKFRNQRKLENNKKLRIIKSKNCKIQ